MRSEWPLVRLAGMASFQEGYVNPSQSEQSYFGNDYKWLRATDLNNGFVYETGRRLSKKGFQSAGKSAVLFEPGTLAISKSGTIGRLGILRDYMCGNRAVINIRPNNRIDTRFLFYSLLNQRPTIETLAEGSVQRNLYVSQLGRVEIALPTLAVQRYIGEVLGSLDDRIDLLRQTNTTLESIAQALFKSWFIDFDPVRAKQAGREPECMDTATAALFPAEFEESALGLIPKGWQVTAIRDVVDDVYDGPHATPPEADEGPVFLGIKNLTGTSIDLNEVRHISEDDWVKWTRRVTPTANDIVFSYEAALGLFSLVPPQLRCCLGRRLALIRPQPVDGSPHFWFHQFVAPPFQRLLSKHTVHGATVNRIALKEFPGYPVLAAPTEVRKAFERIAAPIWAKIHSARQQSLDLT